MNSWCGVCKNTIFLTVLSWCAYQKFCRNESILTKWYFNVNWLRTLFGRTYLPPPKPAFSAFVGVFHASHKVTLAFRWISINTRHGYCRVQLLVHFWQVQKVLKHVKSLDFCSLSGGPPFRQISLKSRRLDVRIIVSLWNLTGISTALLPKCLSNFRANGNV